MPKKTRSPKITSMFSLKRYLLTKAQIRLNKASIREEKRRAKFAQMNQPEEHIHDEYCHHEEEDADRHAETV